MSGYRTAINRDSAKCLGTRTNTSRSDTSRIIATSSGAAGIGTGYSFGSGAPTNQTCGDITINGGIVTATGGMYGAGIGTGYSFYNNAVTSNECGAITIGTGVTSVTAIMGTGSPISIGMGASNGYSGHSGTQTCGTITIGGTVYWDGSNYQNGGGTYLTSNITYTPSN